MNYENVPLLLACIAVVGILGIIGCILWDSQKQAEKYPIEGFKLTYEINGIHGRNMITMHLESWQECQSRLNDYQMFQINWARATNLSDGTQYRMNSAGVLSRIPE